MFKTDHFESAEVSNGEDSKHNAHPFSSNPPFEATKTDKAVKVEKKNLDRAPVWRFVLPFLVIFLALGGQQDNTWANDSGLYDKAIPKDAAFARVIHAGHADQPALNVQIGSNTLSLDANIASPFVVLKPGMNTLTIAGKKYKRYLVSGQKLSLGVDYDQLSASHSVVGEISILPKQKQKQKVGVAGKVAAKKAKANLHLFNFLEDETISLETGNGKHTIIKPVDAGAHNLRSVNPISTDFRVNASGFVLKEFPVQNLREKGDYSFFVFAGDVLPQVVFTIDKVVQN